MEYVLILGGKFIKLVLLARRMTYLFVSQILVIFARMSSFLTAEENLLVFNDLGTGRTVAVVDIVSSRRVSGVRRVCQLVWCLRLEVVQLVLVVGVLHAVHHSVVVVFILVKCLLDRSVMDAVATLRVVGEP